MARFVNGIQVPDDTVVATPPDVRRANGYYRLLYVVENYAHRWVEFDFESPKVSKRVKYRIERQLSFGRRYEVIAAGCKVFIKLKDAATPVKEAGLHGHIFKDEGAVPDSKSVAPFLPA